jgi:hypothetical protein
MPNPAEQSRHTSTTARALASGAAGALVLTALHETARHVVPHAPRMDVIGERALARTLDAAGIQRPGARALFRQTLAGELISNTLYYALVAAGSPSRTLRRGALLGFLAGVGAVVLPPKMGLGRSPGERRPVTPILTLTWYTAGGLAAAAVAAVLNKED